MYIFYKLGSVFDESGHARIAQMLSFRLTYNISDDETIKGCFDHAMIQLIKPQLGGLNYSFTYSSKV